MDKVYCEKKNVNILQKENSRQKTSERHMFQLQKNTKKVGPLA